MTARTGTAPRTGRNAPDRDLVAAVRAELAAIEPARQCCRTAERAGLGRAAHGRAPSPAIGRLVVRLGAGDAVAAATDEPEFDWAGAQLHCRRAYLRGLFLARGSLSLAGGRTHLEVVVPASQMSDLAQWVTDVGLPAGTRVRRGMGVLTWKRADTVTTFLRFVGGGGATLELESRLVTRALRGHLNRVVNAEHANLRRSVETARRQLAAIDVLVRTGELERMPAMARRVAEVRRREPDATFTEIASQLATSRALVQRAFEQLESRALHSQGPIGTR